MSVEDIIKKKNIKLTSARKDILQIFADRNVPLSYEDIKSDLSMDKATFYRNITKFEEENIVNSFESNDKKRYFEIKQKMHAHFVCINCNKIECIKSLELSLDGYEINNIIINGRCHECIKQS